MRPLLGFTLLIAIGVALPLGVAFPPAAASVRAPARVVDVVQINGLIDPPTVSYLEARLAAAQASPSDEAVIVELDSQGGLVGSMSGVVERVFESEVPVVVWVAPRGARAASAGTLLVYAGNLAYMADATTLGTATPVNLNSRESPQPVVDRTAAVLRRLASQRGGSRPPDILSRGGASLTASQAVRAGAIDGVAFSLGDVLQRMDGKTVKLADGKRVRLETWDQQNHRPSVGFRFEGMNLFGRLLHAVTSPTAAYLLLLVGLFALIFETYNPGIGLGAIIGIAALLLSFYSLNILPTNWLGVLLVVGGVALFILDLQLSGFGLWSASGVAGVAGGGWLMFSGAPQGVRLSPFSIVLAVTVSLLFFVSVMTAALRVRLRRPITGEDSLVGTVGEARTDIAPEGTVLTNGLLWRARTMETGIPEGSKVEIKAAEGLVLLVEPLPIPEEPKGSSESAETPTA